MNSAPSGLRLSGNQLSWDQVDGAEYSVKIYTDPDMLNQIYPIGTLALQSTNTLDLTGNIDTGVDYYMKLQAYSFDSAGWTEEINMAFAGFMLQ